MNHFRSSFAAENAVLPLEVALYRACKDQHGSKAAIAEINGFNPMVFGKCIDINNEQYHAKPEHIEAVLSYTKDIRILESLAVAHGGVALFEIPDFSNISDSTFMQKISALSKEMSELCHSISNALEDGKMSEVDVAVIEKDALEFIGVIVAIKKLAREKALQDAEDDQPFFTPESVSGGR